MSLSRIDPEDYGEIYADSTFEVEGYEDQLEQIRDHYPEETKTDEQKLAEQIYNPESTVNQNIPDWTSEETVTGQTIEDYPSGVDTEKYSEIFQPPTQPQTQPQAEGGPPVSDRVREAFSLNYSLDPREPELTAKIKSPNLDDTLEAFQEINADKDLTARFDTNGDGAFTFADMFDTSRWNGGRGITPEQDAQMTEKWVNDITKKNFAARLGSIINNAALKVPLTDNYIPLFGPNKTEFIMNQRRERLAPIEDVYWNRVDDNLAAGTLEWAKSTLSLPEQTWSWITGGNFGGHDAKLDDFFFPTKNKESLAYLIANPAKRNWADSVSHELGYWVPEGVLVAMTLGAGGKKAAVSVAQRFPRYRRLAFSAARFIDPGLGTKVRVGGRWVAKTSFAGKAGTLLRRSVRAGFIETFKGTMQRDFTDANIEYLYNGNPSIKHLIDTIPDANVFGREVTWGVESPLTKRYVRWFDEALMDGVSAGGLFGIFRGGQKVGGKLIKFGQPVLNKVKTSTGNSWSTWAGTVRDGKHWWQIGQRKSQDLVRAGEVQLDADIDPTNPFRRDGTPAQQRSGFGVYKGPDGANDPIQSGISTRSNTRQILNDADDIANQVIKKPGSTDSVLDIVELKKAAKDGVSEVTSQQLAKEFIEDPTLAAQLNSLDFAGRTAGSYGEGTWKRIQAIQGRDAASLSPREFWGDALMDTPLKVGNYDQLDEVQKFVAENLFVADAVNTSLLTQLRDLAASTSEAIGKQDIFAPDSAMQRIEDNLIAGLSNVKKTRLTWSMLAQRLQETNGVLEKGTIDEINGLMTGRLTGLHDETVDGVKLMMQFLKNSDAPELVEGILDVFKVSNDIHNFQDFDAWMRQKVRGGEFRGKVKTGAMIHELQGVMVNSILSGPKTPLRAIMGTTTNAYLNALNEYAGALVRSPFGDDMISRKASFAKLKGMVELVPEAWHVFKENWNSKFTADFANIRTRYSEAPTRSDYNWKLFGEWSERNGTAGDKAAYYLANTGRTLNNNKLLSWSPRAMAATDDTFKWLLARVRSKEMGMRHAFEASGEAWEKMTPDLMKQAEELHFRNLHDADGNIDLSKDAWLNKQFKEITLTSELSGFSKKLDSLLNETPLLKPFYLFARTGINGLNLSFKNTPILGTLHKESLAILSHQGDDFTSLMKYGIENANDLANARNLFAGRQAVGSTVVMGMAGMYMGGQLTGNGPADRQLKQQWINAGWKPNHFYIGDFGFEYSSLEPFNVIFSAIADIGDNLELMGSEWAEKRLQAVAFVVGRGLTGKTYMSGLDQLMQIVQMKPGAMNKAAANILNNSIPLAGARNEFGKWINPHMKELNGSMWDSIRNRNQWAEGFAGKPLPEKSDMLNGKPIRNWNIIGRSFNAISPIQLDIRNDTPGRRLLMDSNYDLKSTTYAYNGYSFVKNAHVRAHFQNAIGTVPIEFRGRKFKNLEAALGYIATLPDVKNSMKAMNANKNNPSKWNIDPNSYPHNTIIDRIIQQARAKAWSVINEPSHPGFVDLQEVKNEKDGMTAETRNERQDILDLSFKKEKFETFPK